MLSYRHEERLLFLKQFTKHLIINSKPELSKPKENLDFEPKEIPKIEPVLKSFLEKPTEKGEKPKTEFKPIHPPMAQIKKRIKPAVFQEFRHLQMMPKPGIQQPAQFQQTRPQIQPEVQPQPAKPPEQFDLGKINQIIRDPAVTVVECPGPNKFVLVRAGGKTTMTKISLNQNEIHKIIQNFSETAKIPIMSGVFKAAVGNLVISAIISDLVGNRFIITKITPRFMIEQRNFHGR